MTEVRWDSVSCEAVYDAVDKLCPDLRADLSALVYAPVVQAWRALNTPLDIRDPKALRHHIEVCAPIVSEINGAWIAYSKIRDDFCEAVAQSAFDAVWRLTDGDVEYCDSNIATEIAYYYVEPLMNRLNERAHDFLGIVRDIAEDFAHDADRFYCDYPWDWDESINEPLSEIDDLSSWIRTAVSEDWEFGFVASWILGIGDCLEFID